MQRPAIYLLESPALTLEENPNDHPNEPRNGAKSDEKSLESQEENVTTKEVPASETEVFIWQKTRAACDINKSMEIKA